MNPRFVKLAAAGAVVLSCAAAFATSPTWSTWSKSPMTMKWHADASCKVIIKGVTQDGRGQAIKLQYQNGSSTDRERFTVKIRVVQNGTTYDGGTLSVDNLNPNESGNIGASPSFAGNIASGGTLSLQLTSCSFPT